MAYDARPKEMLEALQESGLPPEAQETIRRAFESYFRQREGRIENLLELLEPGDKPHMKLWLDKGMDAVRMVHDTFKRIDVEEAEEWLAGVATQEHKFFFALYRLGDVAKQRDRMVEQSENLETAMEELEGKWAKIKSSDASLDDKMKKAAAEYEKILVDVAHHASETEKQAKERMADNFEKALKLGLKAVDLGVVEKVLTTATKVLKAQLSQAQARKLEIFALLSREEQVYASFKETRGVVAEFLETNGYPMIKDALDDGEDAAEKLERGMATDGQKRDAAEIARKMKDELGKMFSAAERSYRDFAKEHEYLFFGPLGSSYVQELAEDDTWKRASEGWKRRRSDFDDLLRERTLEASGDRILEVSLGELSSDDRANIRQKLGPALRDLLKVWNEWKDWSDDPYWILENREQLKRILAALR